MVYGKRLARQLSVCPDCGHHLRLTAAGRVAQLLDEGSVEYLPAAPDSGDPLNFVDTRPYRQRLAEARAETGLPDAVLSARGTIHGHPVVLAVMDFRF